MDENGIDPKTNKVVPITTGRKGWIQADLKFFFGVVLFKTRPGIKVSYQRGSLPPVYSYTKSFNFGFVFESTDDDNSGK